MWKSDLAAEPKVGRVGERSQTVGQARPRYELFTQPLEGYPEIFERGRCWKLKRILR